MAKWQIKHKNGQAELREFKSRRITFRMLLLKQVDPMVVIQMELIYKYKQSKEKQCLVGTLKALHSVYLANKDSSKKFGPIEGLI